MRIKLITSLYLPFVCFSNSICEMKAQTSALSKKEKSYYFY